MKVRFEDRQIRIEHFRIALNMCGLSISYEQADLILRVYEKVKELKGEFSIDHSVKIVYEWDNEWDDYFKGLAETKAAT